MSTPIRAARAADTAAIAACVHAAYQPYVERIGKPPGPMLDDYARTVREHDVHVAEHDGRIVGIVVLQQHGDGVLLDNIAVHPDHAGAGLGRTLLAFAEARAAARGFATLELYTHALMHENIAWYARNGYVETARVREQGFDRVYMRKALAPPPPVTG
jgi:ribosomal protein S18 acetylase RimI-like enzyme